MPSLHTLTIPEQDDRAPEEDWTAGLPIVRRGIQFGDWKEIVGGVLLSLEQTVGGFGDPTVVFIATLFVVSEGLDIGHRGYLAVMAYLDRERDADDCIEEHP